MVEIKTWRNRSSTAWTTEWLLTTDFPLAKQPASHVATAVPPRPCSYAPRDRHCTSVSLHWRQARTPVQVNTYHLHQLSHLQQLSSNQAKRPYLKQNKQKVSFLKEKLGDSNKTPPSFISHTPRLQSSAFSSSMCFRSSAWCSCRASSAATGAVSLEYLWSFLLRLF